MKRQEGRRARGVVEWAGGLWDSPGQTGLALERMRCVGGRAGGRTGYWAWFICT